MHYLYKITNQVNQKVYIGQSIQPNIRWSNHKSDAKSGKPIQYIHHAMAKYGVENFIFEIIDVGLNQYQADCLEANYIMRYNSRDKNHGYNLKSGGNVSKHSEETKKKQSDATIKQIVEKGHPAEGTKRTDEQRAKMSAIQQSKDNDAIYTDEVRKNMSEAHIGIKDTEKTKKNKSESAKMAWEKRQAELEATGTIKCNVQDCDVAGTNESYLIVDNIRYCSKHGQRLKKHGTLELIPRGSKKI